MQHAPGREWPLARLLTQLPEGTEVITDEGGDPPNPWRGYQLCLQDPPLDASHLSVFQDDAICSPGLTVALERILEAWPEQVICLCLTGSARATMVAFSRARQHGRLYCDLSMRDHLPLVAAVWPVRKAAEFLEWSVDARLPGMPREIRSDDAVAGQWQRMNRERVIVTVPSLVEHPDDVPSTVTDRARGGRDKSRVAFGWYGPDGDCSELDW